MPPLELLSGHTTLRAGTLLVSAQPLRSQCLLTMHFNIEHSGSPGSVLTCAPLHSFILSFKKKKLSRIYCSVVSSLMIQQLKLHTSNTRDTCLIPGQGPKIPHALQRHGQKNKEFFFFLKKKELTVLQVLDLVILKNEKPASVLQKL